MEIGNWQGIFGLSDDLPEDMIAGGIAHDLRQVACRGLMLRVSVFYIQA